MKHEIDKEKVLKESEELFCQNCINAMGRAKEKMSAWQLANPFQVKKNLSSLICNDCKRKIAKRIQRR